MKRLQVLQVLVLQVLQVLGAGMLRLARRAASRRGAARGAHVAWRGMPRARIEKPAGARPNGRRGHHVAGMRLRAPNRIADYPGAIGVATRALAPWGRDAYPGLPAIARAAFLGRASDHTIRDWRRGKRKAPGWARGLLREAIERRIAELEHARALLAETGDIDSRGGSLQSPRLPPPLT